MLVLSAVQVQAEIEALHTGSKERRQVAARFKPQEKNESCVTQDKTVYQAKAKFILARIDPPEINTVYCV